MVISTVPVDIFVNKPAPGPSRPRKSSPRLNLTRNLPAAGFLIYSICYAYRRRRTGKVSRSPSKRARPAGELCATPRPEPASGARDDARSPNDRRSDYPTTQTHRGQWLPEAGRWAGARLPIGSSCTGVAPSPPLGRTAGLEPKGRFLVYFMSNQLAQRQACTSLNSSSCRY